RMEEAGVPASDWEWVFGRRSPGELRSDESGSTPVETEPPTGRSDGGEHVDNEKAYADLAKQLSEGEHLLQGLDGESGLSPRHLAWLEQCRTLIAMLDPFGKPSDHSSPVGMFYHGWEHATMSWSALAEAARRQKTVDGFASAVGALRAIVER